MFSLCFSYSLTTRLIGLFGVTVSILMINILVSDFLSAEKPDTFSATVESWTLFGLNWTYFLKHVQKLNQARYLLICVLVYAGSSLFANTMLCLASIMKRPTFVIPWIYVQVISIVDQSFAIVVRLFYLDFEFYKRSTWSLPMASFYLLVSAYFLINVCSARIYWINYSPREIRISTITRSYVDQQGSNLPKSPSYLADHSFFINSPRNMSTSNKYENI